MKKEIFRGSAPALITPFTKDGVDFEAFGRLIDFQIENGSSALVVCGTTGEPATMTYEERARTLDFALERVNKRVPVIVGTGSNATSIVIDNCKKAYAAGADAVLVVTPYYNKCTQTGLIKHFEAVCSSTPLPVIAYSVPSRTGVNIEPKSFETLVEFDTFAAIKEASGSMDQITDICARVGDKIAVYSGDDGITIPLMSIGGKGVISVVANVAPKFMADMCDAFFAGDIQKAGKMQRDVYPLVKAMFCEVNPIPVKTAASLMGYGECNLRLPLCDMSSEHLALLKSEMKKFGLLGE